MTDDAVDSLIAEATNILAKYDLKIKGWAKSGHLPPDKISVDGKVAIGGLLWNPVLDKFSLKLAKIHNQKSVKGNMTGIKVF